MRKIDYFVGGSLMKVHDAAYPLDDADLAQVVAESVIETVSLDVEVSLGEVKIHLAALLDPDHWEDDWREAGVEDVEEFLAGLVSE